MKVRHLVGLIALTFILGCGGANGIKTVSGVFLTTTSDGKDVAIVAHSPTSGARRTIDVYVTDGATVSEFFTGTVNGNIFQLSNADGEVDGTIDSFGASGTVTLNSSSSSFDAQSTSSPAGLYTVTIDMAAGTVSGTSSNGGTLSGTIGTTLVGNNFEVTGSVTASGGSPQNIDVFITQDSDGTQDWIVLPNLSVTGGQVGTGTGFASS